MKKTFLRSFPFLCLGWAFLALPARAQTNFQVFNVSPTTIAQYGSPFTYSVAWTNGAYSGGNGNGGGSAGVFIYSFTARGATINVDSLYPPNGGFSYTVANVGSSDNGSTFSITCNGGNTESTYGQMTLYVAPAILVQPTNTNCVFGTLTSLGMSAGPSNSSYQWINAANGTIIASSATFEPNPSMNGDLIYCRVYNAYGEAISSNVLLNVGTAPAISTQYGTTQPYGTTNIAVGGSGTLTVTATGTAPISYQWFHNGLSVPGANLNYLTFSPATLTDAGTYSVAVSNSFGATNSSIAMVNVGIAPLITTQPVSLTVTQGQTASFGITASGTQLSYLWKLNGQTVFGGTNATLNIANASSYNSGTYTCQVTNFLGSVTSLGAVLTVSSAPVITVQPSSSTVAVGSALTESVSATGTAPLAFQWLFNATNLPGFTTSSFTITNAQVINSGLYSVVISNQFGSVTSSVANVMVENFAPIIQVQPLSQSVLVNGNASLSVVASGSPTLAYQWYQSQPAPAGARPTIINGFVVGITVTNGGAGYLTIPNVQIVGGGGSGAAATAVVSNGMVTGIDLVSAGSDYTNAPAIVIDPPYAALNGETNAVLTIVGVTTNAAANYFVVVTDASGSVTSSSATLTVNAPVYITAQPQNEIVAQGDGAIFSVSVAGSTPFGFQWYVLPATNNNAAATAEVFDGFVYGADVTSGGAGYANIPNVEIIGGGGSGATAAAVISNGTVIAIDVISAGSDYTGTPEIQIDPPLVVGLNNQTNAVLSLASVSTNDAGNYFVVVNNGFASVTSTQATLLVGLPPQNLTLSNHSGNGVQLQMSGTPNFPYAVQVATNLVPPVQWQSILTNNADTNGLWQYSDTNLNRAQQFYRVGAP